MDKIVISQEKIDEILSRSVYWDEIVKREESNVGAMLWHEMVEITHSLGIDTLWILKEYAKEYKKTGKA